MANMTVFDISGAEPIKGTLPDNEVEAALQSGRFSLPMGDVKVINPEGVEGTLPASEVPQALGAGFKLLTPSLAKEREFSTLGQQAITGLEGAAEGIAGPLATLAETELLGVPKEDILARREVNPWTHTAGQVAGLLAPMGQGALLTKAGAGAAKALGAEGVANLAARGAVEAALYQAGDATSRVILEDPALSTESAIAEVGLAAALGGGVGGALGVAGKGLSLLGESKAVKFVRDFKGRVGEHIANPSPEQAIADELGALYSNVKATGQGIGLKREEIAHLLKDVPTEKINAEATSIVNKFEELIATAKSKPESLAGVADALERDLLELNAGMRSGPADFYKALDELRQKFGQYAFEKKAAKFTAADNFKAYAKPFYQDLKLSLENEAVWGAAGKRQQAFNKAFTEFLTPLNEFEKMATSVLNGERVMDPGKLQTYINQVGSARGELKQSKVGNFIRAAEKYQAELNKTHETLGLNALEGVSLQNTMATLKGKTAGAMAADALIRQGLDKMGGGLGAVVGGAIGGGWGAFIGREIGDAALGPIIEKVLPALAKSIMEKETNGAGLQAAISLGKAIVKGEQRIQKAALTVIEGGAAETKIKPQQIELLKEKVTQIRTNPMVLMEQNERKLAHYMPEHESLLSLSSARVLQYLAQLEPNTQPKAPLDGEIKPNSAAVARYNSALQIAQDPVSVLNKIPKGTLTGQDIQDVSMMYPELYRNLQNQLTTQILEQNAKGKKIPYKIRLGASKFIGQPLDTSISPQAVMFSTLPPPTQPMPTAAKSQKMMKQAQFAMTPNQARMASKLKPGQ